MGRHSSRSPVHVATVRGIPLVGRAAPAPGVPGRHATPAGGASTWADVARFGVALTLLVGSLVGATAALTVLDRPAAASAVATNVTGPPVPG